MTRDEVRNRLIRADEIVEVARTDAAIAPVEVDGPRHRGARVELVGTLDHLDLTLLGGAVVVLDLLDLHTAGLAGDDVTVDVLRRLGHHEADVTIAGASVASLGGEIVDLGQRSTHLRQRRAHLLAQVGLLRLEDRIVVQICNRRIRRLESFDGDSLVRGAVRIDLPLGLTLKAGALQARGHLPTGLDGLQLRVRPHGDVEQLPRHRLRALEDKTYVPGRSERDDPTAETLSLEILIGQARHGTSDA